MTRRNRRGATTVEMAIVLIPLVILIIGFVEIGCAVMTMHRLEEAARIGCRQSIISDATTESVTAEVDHLLNFVGITEYELEIEPADLASAPRWSPITVSISVDLEDVSWMPVPSYLQSISFDSSCTLPKENSATN